MCLCSDDNPEWQERSATPEERIIAMARNIWPDMEERVINYQTRKQCTETLHALLSSLGAPYNAIFINTELCLEFWP